MEDDGYVECMNDLSTEYTLKIGMQFESEEEAYTFYNDHGKIMGFSIRRNYLTKSRKDDVAVNRKFVCSKQGHRVPDKRNMVVEKPRKETRSGCEAFMYISFNRETSKWVVTNFLETHNHHLHLPQCTYLMRSQRKIREVQALNMDLAADSGLSLKASHDLLSAQVGGREFVGFTHSDHKSYLRGRRQRSLKYGEAGALLKYFESQSTRNPYFFYAFQLDVDEMITNIFWADHGMILDYGLFGDAVSYDTTFHDSPWITKTWELRNKWAHVYMKWSFTCGMRSTQLSESINAKIKKYVKFDHDIAQFFTHFDRLVTEKRDNESDSIYHSREKLPRLRIKKYPMLIQVATLYTPPIFDLFHDEVDASICCFVEEHHEFEGEFKCVIGLHERSTLYFVTGNIELDEFGKKICRNICCSCRKFESFGLLCCHAIKGLDRMCVSKLPQSYILRRWCLDAKDCAFKGDKVIVMENDPKFVKAARYRNLCPKLVQLGARSCELKNAYDFVDKTVDYMCEEVNKMFLHRGDPNEVEAEQENVVGLNLHQAKGLKTKAVVRNGRSRLKPWHENIGKRKKVASKCTGLREDICGSSVQHTLSTSQRHDPYTFEVSEDWSFLHDDDSHQIQDD